MSSDPIGSRTGERAKKRRWTIEVCRSCGRLAQWPFCEHKPERMEFLGGLLRGGESWVQRIVVQEVGRRG